MHDAGSHVILLEAQYQSAPDSILLSAYPNEALEDSLAHATSGGTFREGPAAVKGAVQEAAGQLPAIIRTESEGFTIECGPF
jgi:hypothetical protein